MERHVINGLDRMPLDYISKSIRGLGFNCVRLPFSLELVDANPSVKDYTVSANPQLKYKKAMDVFDEVIKSLTSNGVMVVLNNHVSDAIWCCSSDDGNGMWFNPKYPEDKWIDILKQLTVRYKDNPMVIGNDLRNELR